MSMTTTTKHLINPSIAIFTNPELRDELVNDCEGQVGRAVMRVGKADYEAGFSKLTADEWATIPTGAWDWWIVWATDYDLYTEAYDNAEWDAQHG